MKKTHNIFSEFLSGPMKNPCPMTIIKNRVIAINSEIILTKIGFCDLC